MAKKIGIIIGSIAGGGAERFTVNMANYLMEQEIEVFLYTGKKEENEYELSSKIKRIEIMQNSFLKDVIAIKKDAVNNNIPTLIGIGIYCNLCACLDKLIGYKGKVIISERNAPKYDLISWKSRILRFFLYRFTDKMVFQTHQAYDFYSKSIQKKGVIIHNPIKQGLPYRTGKNNKEIIFLGRLMKQKNPHLMLDAFTDINLRYPEYILRFFGIGSLEGELRAIVKERHIEDKVVFEGWQGNAHELIKDSDIFVMTSDFEGMPNSLIEAMAMGFPVVSSDCPAGGPAELIVSGENGMLFKTGDKEDLVSKLEYLIVNIDEKERMGEAAKDIRNTHSDEVIIGKWLEII